MITWQEIAGTESVAVLVTEKYFLKRVYFSFNRSVPANADFGLVVSLTTDSSLSGPQVIAAATDTQVIDCEARLALGQTIYIHGRNADGNAMVGLDWRLP